MRLYLCLALLLVPALGAPDYFDPDYSIEHYEIEPTKIKSEEIEPTKVKSEEIESEEIEPDEIESEETESEEIESEETESEEIESEETESEEIESEEVESEEVEPDEIEPDETESEEVESGEVKPDVIQIEENERDERGFSGGLDLDNGFCPHPFSQILDECFYTSDIKLHWQAARHYCRGMDGDLASPSHVSALHAFIRTHQVDENVYLGGTNTGQTKKWLWLSGEAINKNDWYRGQPDNHYGEEHCLVMYYDYDPPLYDDSCERKRHFVCEFKSR